MRQRRGGRQSIERGASCPKGKIFLKKVNFFENFRKKKKFPEISRNSMFWLLYPCYRSSICFDVSLMWVLLKERRFFLLCLLCCARALEAKFRRQLTARRAAKLRGGRRGRRTGDCKQLHSGLFAAREGARSEKCKKFRKNQKFLNFRK